MKVNIATRIFNEEWYLDYFIQYYLDLGIDEIHFFDSGSQDATLKIIRKWSKKNPSIKLIISDNALQFTSDSKEMLVCNRVIQHAKETVQQTQENTWWIFADIDEFLRPPETGVKEFFKNTPHSVVRSVFFDWYLPPKMYEIGVTVKTLLQMVREKKVKGRLLDLLGDPFYKDFVFYFTPENINTCYATLRTIPGNHRYFVNNEILIPPNGHFLLFDHVRGVSNAVTTRRINTRLMLMENQAKKHQDQWMSLHFQRIKEELTDYKTFYKSLHSFQELEAQISKISAYDNDISEYNKVAYYYILTQEPGHSMTEPDNYAR